MRPSREGHIEEFGSTTMGPAIGRKKGKGKGERIIKGTELQEDKKVCVLPIMVTTGNDYMLSI